MTVFIVKWDLLFRCKILLLHKVTAKEQ